MNDKTRIMILDGNSLIYRAFYAIPLLTSSEGIYTNAVYGFINMMLKVLSDEKPGCIAVAFDKGKVTFRNEKFDDYKGTRKATPDELKPQFAYVKEILKAMNIPIYELEGYEADDLIGTVTRKAEEEGYASIVVTGDRDALQLISQATSVMLTKKGISETEVYDIDKVMEKYGLVPEQMIDVKGLMGDSSDNIPGVPGIGEKTALKLINTYGSLENIYENINELTPKMREKLDENHDMAFLSRELATIVRDVPFELDLMECHLEEPDYEKLMPLLRKLEFKTLINSFAGRMKAAGLASSDFGQVLPDCREEYECTLLPLHEGLDRLASDLDKGEISISYELSNADPMLAELTGFSWSVVPGVAVSVTGIAEGQAELFKEEEDISCLAAMAECRSGVKKYCHDGKRLMVALDRYGIRWESIAQDTLLAAYLLNPTGRIQDLSDLIAGYLGKELTVGGGSTGAGISAAAILDLQKVFHQKLEEDGLDDLYYNVELPLTRILADMEITGIRVDRDRLAEMSIELEEKLKGLTLEIYGLSGEEFNINSPKQLGYILFEKMGLPVIKKTKTGYSTDVEVLERLAAEHGIAEKILEFRQLAKLKSTYVDGLSGLINPRTGRLHTTFNQAVTATGRLSSVEPNLQNIPVRLEEGRKIRKAFVPSEQGYRLLAADYSQIELRVLAHISGDANFISAFREGQDIHTHTASEVFGVPENEVTREMRDGAKAVNFGIVYGISEFGLARNIKITRQEARKYIDGYLDRYPGIREFMNDIVAQARENGYVTTIMNRRRYIPDIKSRNHNVRAFGERTAMNTPIQGSAADIIKMAMVRVAKCLKREGLKTKMLLQVHDELIFEVPEEEMGRAVPLIKECMENAVELEVPLVVDMKAGTSWYEMKKILF
ncbi:DNA polymerase I [Phosphitispora sp. TUW77]|uniref:DNA polymerase I n=1 Tax=Phosphitispora sp. TUW77 TaxID=3152361 RepID=UPI003AB80D56